MKDLDRVITICPNCAESGNAEIWKGSTPKRLKKYYVHCDECDYCAPRAFTKRGAMKNWSREWQRRFLK